MMDFISNDGGETYNRWVYPFPSWVLSLTAGLARLHFWSNFEIARLDFWRSPAYRAYFDYLDQAGGFFYERWGDAPVHSIAVALFMRPDEVEFFQDIGYRHEPFQHCPKGLADKCACDP